MTDFVNSVGFQEAMAYAAKRKVVLPEDYYGKLIGLQRAQSVSIAGLAALEQIRFVVDKLADVLEKGGTFKSFQDAVRAGGIDVNLPTHRLENIFRTNIQAAYSRGRWEQQMRVRDSRPYLMYDAINDSRTRPAHAAMDNIIRRWDDPFWATHYPTNGYRCRCTVISLTEAQAKKRGGVTDPLPDPDTTKPDPGWDHNPGADYEPPIHQRLDAAVTALEEKTKRASASLAKTRRKIEDSSEAAKTLTRLGGLHEDDIADFREELARFAKANPDKAKALDPTAASFLFGYSRSNYHAINSYLRTADGNDPGVREVLKLMQKMLDKASKALPATTEKLYRGTTVLDIAEFKRKHISGATLQTRGILSTTTDEAVAKSFYDHNKTSVIYEIDNPKGVGVNLSEFGANVGEGETLLAPGTVFRVKSVEQRGNSFLVKLEAQGVKQKATFTFSVAGWAGAVKESLEDTHLSESAWLYWLSLLPD
jgi:SPP1 gp7 family putative phage head morphogenesis protein